MSEDKIDSNNNMVQAQDLEWEETTVSGKIFSQLRLIGQRQGVPVTISNKDGTMETFTFGDEKTYLLKRLENGTVGSSDGILVTYAEAYHFKRLSWWKEAIEKGGGNIGLLDVPVLWAAKDSGISGYQQIFSPAEVISGHGLKNEQGFPGREDIEKSIKEIIASSVSPLVGPDFEVRDFAGGLRLAAITNEAIESRRIDNDVYKAAIMKIGQAGPAISEKYSLLFQG